MHDRLLLWRARFGGCSFTAFRGISKIRFSFLNRSSSEIWPSKRTAFFFFLILFADIGPAIIISLSPFFFSLNEANSIQYVLSWTKCAPSSIYFLSSHNLKQYLTVLEYTRISITVLFMFYLAFCFLNL